MPFVFNSWLKCYKASDFGRHIQNEVYFAGQHKVIEGLVKRAKCVIACNNLDPAQIFGYAVGEIIDGVFVCHFTYVKEAYRKLGLASLLLKELGHTPGTPFMYTHRTFQAERMEKAHSMIYHPFLAFYGFPMADVSVGQD